MVHRQAARSLAARAHADPLAVAHHARLGGDPAAAATALARAGEIAANRFDFTEALRLMDEAVALDSRPEILISRARLRIRTSDGAGARADAEAARERSTPAEPHYAAALEVGAVVAYVDRNFERSRRLAEEAANRTDDPELRASSLALAGRVRHATGDLVGARTLLDQVGQGAPASIAPVVDLWRGFVYVHADEPARTLRLLAGSDSAITRTGYPFAPVNRHMLAGYAQALRGEPEAALAELDLMSVAAERESTDRFTGRDENFRGWILRGLGAWAAADDANTRAYEQSAALRLAEPVAHALLDLADGRLRAGEPTAAIGYLDALKAEASEGYLFQWRAELRTLLIEGRCQVATGDSTAAMAAFDLVASKARALSLRRYEVQAGLWFAIARRAAGEQVDVDTVGPYVDLLDAVAPLEAWWLTAEAAVAFQADRWHRLAQERANRLAQRAGRYGDDLRRAADALRSRRDVARPPTA